MKCLLLPMLVLVFTAAAADVSGTWKAATEMPNKLTGSTSSQFTHELKLTLEIAGRGRTIEMIAKRAL